jgi:hypothetical protein
VYGGGSCELRPFGVHITHGIPRPAAEILALKVRFINQFLMQLTYLLVVGFRSIQFICKGWNRFICRTEHFIA